MSGVVEIMDIDDPQPGPSKPREETQIRKPSNLPW